MIKKYVRLIPVLIVGIAGVIFTPVSASDLDDYKKKQIEYNEKKKNHEDFVQMSEEYKEDYSDLAMRYEQAQNEYKLYKEKYNSSIDLNKELNELLEKRDRYLNLIEEYSSQLDNLYGEDSWEF